jgi:hypothetical protein
MSEKCQRASTTHSPCGNSCCVTPGGAIAVSSSPIACRCASHSFCARCGLVGSLMYSWCRGDSRRHTCAHGSATDPCVSDPASNEPSETDQVPSSTSYLTAPLSTPACAAAAVTPLRGWNTSLDCVASQSGPGKMHTKPSRPAGAHTVSRPSRPASSAPARAGVAGGCVWPTPMPRPNTGTSRAQLLSACHARSSSSGGGWH